MKSDGFPNAVAVVLSIALAFAVSLFAAFAFGGGALKNRAAVSYSLPRERTFAAAPAIQAIRIPSAM